MGTTFSRPVSNIRSDNLLFPPEILEVILTHLSPTDKLVARKVCQDWNFHISLIGLDKYFLVKLEHTEELFQTILNSPIASISWSNFFLRNINLTRSSSLFWSDYGEFITSLELDDCSIIPRNSESDTNEFIMGCPNLKHLGLTNCNKYMMMGGNFFNLPKLLVLENLESLNLSRNSYLNDSILFSLLLEIKSLQSLNLSSCPLAFMSAIFGRFYPGVQDPQSELKKFSDNILTFQMLHLSFLSTPRALHMKELNFSDTRMNHASLELISDSDHYHWERIILNCCTELNGASLLTFISYQPFITKLDLERTRLTNNQLNTINLSGLKYLSLKGCQDFTELNFLRNIPNLEYLDLTHCFNINYVSGVLSSVSKLVVLKIRSIRLLQVFQELNPILVSIRLDLIKLKHLSELDLGNTITIVNDDLVQKIIQHLTRLKILKLCKSIITDEGLVGRMIVNEFPVPVHPGYCLSQLEHLRVLSLANCLDVGERTWTLGLRLLNLVSLDLTKCSQISRSGVSSIIQYCPNLEHLVLLDCRIRDEPLVSNLRNMPRMRHLVI